MKKGITFGGLDAHKVAIDVATLLPGETKPVKWQLASEANGGSADGEEDPAASTRHGAILL